MEKPETTKLQDKIKKNDIQSCRHFKNFTEEGKIIKFKIRTTTWTKGEIGEELLEVEAPNINYISLSSFKPSTFYNINIGPWVQKLIGIEKSAEENKQEIPNYEESMRLAAKQWIEQYPEAELGIDFVDLAIKTIQRGLKK